MPYAVVIPSAKIENVVNCVSSIRARQSAARVIVVSDGIPESARPAVSGVEWVDGSKPFSFARNANLGISAAGSDDVILCNDDITLDTLSGFDRLSAAAPVYGIISPVISGRCSNDRQKQASNEIRSEPQRLVFVCVYIARATIKVVGMLDERFECGCWEDDDYCARAIRAGVTLGIHGRVLVTHHADRTTFSKLPNYKAILDANGAVFAEKHAKTRIALSVCVCSIFTRSHYLARLEACLRPQLGVLTEYLLAVDDGQVSIGEKRQSLLTQARGDFVVFIDDDDQIAPDYGAEILRAIEANPAADAVTFLSKRYCDGVFEAICKYSITNAKNTGSDLIDGLKVYSRWPYHVTPIRRDLATRIGFASLDHGEDTDFATRLRPLIKSEVFIDKFLYFYFWRSDRTAERTHRMLGRIVTSPPPPAVDRHLFPALAAQ